MQAELKVVGGRKAWLELITSGGCHFVGEFPRAGEENSRSFATWLFQPNWKILVKMGIFPKVGVKIKIFETTNQFWVFLSRNVKFHPPKNKLMEEQFSMFSLTIGSMYGIFTNIYRKNDLNVGKHSIHGSYRYVFLSDSEKQHPVMSVLFQASFGGRHLQLLQTHRKAASKKDLFAGFSTTGDAADGKNSCTTWVV